MRRHFLRVRPITLAIIAIWRPFGDLLHRRLRVKRLGISLPGCSQKKLLGFAGRTPDNILTGREITSAYFFNDLGMRYTVSPEGKILADFHGPDAVVTRSTTQEVL